MKLFLSLAVCAFFVPSSVMAQLGRHGSGTRVNVQNRSANVNRNSNVNVNRNANVNVNRNVNVNVNDHGGCWNCGYNHDNNWNWGSFAAGAAVGAVTTAAVASAAHSSSSTTVVVAAPSVGTLVPTLPAGCTSVSAGGTVVYNCNSVYYRPSYQGAQLVYQVVTYP
jgi:outer membrane usher protein FimD/PapC